VPLILALDTSSSLGSVALARGETILATRSFEADHGHSQRLLPAIDSTFTEAGIEPAAVDLFAVVAGPGSFTGLRVSLASMRGLAGRKPCFGALATETAAWAARGRGAHILAITDLFHGEVFASVHDAAGALISKQESGDLDAVLTALKGPLGSPAIAVGSAIRRHRPAIEATFPGIALLDLDGGLAPALASLALARASDSSTLGPASDILPFYLRDPLTRGLLATQPKTK
jgi:tRNA threonylcarbamoyladenosine biosynthesis protein TsaB